MPNPFPDDIRDFVESATWTFAKTYADTWPHEYAVRDVSNEAMLVALARHIFEHGTGERFYAQIRKYYHEAGKVYWSMDPSPESTTLINRCDESQTFESRAAAGTLPPCAPAESEEIRLMTDTVLAHLTASMTQQENLATAALAFILNRSQSAREALHRQIVAVLGDLAPVSRVATEVAVGEESRPDVQLRGDNDETLGYVEVKFWAALTDAQPVEYVRRLVTTGGGVLVILAPERRLPTLRMEVRQRLASADLTLSDTGAIQATSGTVRLGFLSWAKLLSVLRDAVSEDRAAASDVDQLRGLVSRVETEGFTPLTRSDVDGLDVPRRMIALADLVNDIVNVAVENGVLSVKGLRPTHFIYGSGRYVSFGTAGCWLGLHHKMWSTRGMSPIWTVFSLGDFGRADRLWEPLRSWMNADPPRAYADDGSVQVPLALPVGVEKDHVVKDAVRQLRAIKEAISMMPPLAGAAPPES